MPQEKCITIKAGKVELSQEQADIITLRRKNSSGQIVVVKIRATQLERWAVRQMREGAFS